MHRHTHTSEYPQNGGNLTKTRTAWPSVLCVWCCATAVQGAAGGGTGDSAWHLHDFSQLHVHKNNLCQNKFNLKSISLTALEVRVCHWRGDPICKGSLGKVYVEGQGILNIVPKEKPERELRPNRSTKWTRGWQPKAQQQDHYTGDGALDLWWEPAKQWGHHRAEPPECGPGAGRWPPSSEHILSGNRVGARQEGEIWAGPRAWARSTPHREIHTEDLPPRGWLTFPLGSESASASYWQLLQHLKDFPWMLETVNLNQEQNVIGIVPLLHKKL